MVREDTDFDFEISPEVEDDLRILNGRCIRNPHDVRARNLLTASLTSLGRLKEGDPGRKDLGFLPTYGDLSDCRTMYVQSDPTYKPSHRIVFRDVPADGPGSRPRREVIALGERDNGRVYHMAVQRLGRPVGYTLAELAQHSATQAPDIEPQVAHAGQQPEF